METTPLLTPETTSYMILGFVVSLGILAFYAASLAARLRGARKDAETLRLLDED
jgi:hypothetical protein